MNFLEGQKLVKQKEYGKALNIFLNLQKDGINNKDIYFYLGLIYSELNDFNKSISNYNEYLISDPDSKSALFNLAIAKQSIGEIDSAKNIYLKLISLERNNIRPYFALLMLDINFLTDEHYQYIIDIRKSEKISLYEKSLVYFILAKREKKNKNYKKEIDNLKNFNINSFNSNYAYNKSAQFYYKKIINNYYNKIQFINNKDAIKNENYYPIFIIGLPRSGSTLLESVLTSSNEGVKTCAESHVINMAILEQIGPKIYTKNFNSSKFIFEINQMKLENSVLQRYKNFNVTNKNLNFIFVDKSLENFFNIDVIIKIFPNARFLHTFRDPVDSIISIYQSMLPDLSWTHSIEDILDYIDKYKKVINYFKTKYPEKIMDIDLKKFTHNAEETGEKIYKFCKLKWSKRYLEFYKRKDLYSKTISFNQIRQKISIYDIKKYEPYIDLLEQYKDKYKWIKNI
jgi:tetratricopeptide (TPR) repeat protein